LEEPGVYGRIILKWLFEKWDGTDLAHDTDRWRAVWNAVTNFSGSTKCGEFVE
jgi:hypothetical protein